MTIEKFPSHINVSEIVSELKSLLPYELYSGLEGIYVGTFKELEQRNVQAIFKDGVIYLSSHKNNPKIDMETILKHIVHEIGHLVEDRFANDVYGDQNIEIEYLTKKRNLVNILKSNGINFQAFFQDISIQMEFILPTTYVK